MKPSDSDNDAIEDEFFLIHPSENEDKPQGTTLSFSQTPAILLVFAANRYTREAARIYQEQYQMSALEWRMLVMLMREPGSSVSHASRTIGVDKAAISRCLRKLEEKELACPRQLGNDERRKAWHLTSAGVKLHDQILPVSLGLQKKMLDGFSKEELETFIHLLSRALTNITN